jgi:hypothetical protein
LDFIVTDEGLDCQVSISAKERNIFLLHQIWTFSNEFL